MSAAMNPSGKHEFHPDAESLNAFAEQALSEQERGQVLKHLAVCGRCRQVVTLAREAAFDAVVVAPAAAGEHARRKKSRFGIAWQFAWIPAAALAATAALAVYVHVRHVDESAEMAKNEPRQTAQGAPVAAHPPLEQAQSAPPAASTHAKSPAHAARPAPESGPPREAAAVPAQGASETAPTLSQTVTASAPEVTEEQATPVAGAMMMHRPAIEAPAQRIPSFALKSAPPAAKLEQQKLAEQQRQTEQRHAEIEAMQGRIFAATAAAQSSVQDAEGGAEENRNPQMMGSAQPPIAAAAAAPRPAAQAPSGIAIDTVGGVEKIYLPSGLRVESIASVGPRVLAIDMAGAVFLSKDSGETWEHVTPQWTGRAVKVRRQMANRDKETARATASANAGSGAGEAGALAAPASPPPPAAAPPPPIFFELLNDLNQVWLSTDGKTWIAK